ncbi:cyclin-domain-containing protein [Panus rudis PR-1116 ss-1]|nr:cyclin-domain-containing protein [Panus rudis PR-1116 ss-1]
METSPLVELPAGFEDVDVNILAELIADMMERLLAHNDKIPLTPESLTWFHSRSAPNISVVDYLRRIVKFTKVERVCLLITLHYIDQICARVPSFSLSSLTCHRFIITAITLSSKALCDVMHPNHVYAKVGGIPVTELNVLEREFLRMIDWNLITTRDVLQEYYVNLVRTHSKQKYIIVGTQSSSSVSSDSDMDYESSRPASPVPTPTGSNATGSPVGTNGHEQDSVPHEPSTILIDPSTISPVPPRPPTVEQNMAFQAFQQSSGVG